MKRNSTVFLRGVVVLIGLVALALMIRFPLTEGRAANLDLFRIYADPFVLCEYLASIAFFIALYQAFRLLGYVGQNKVFSLNSVKALRTIKYCAITLCSLIVLAGIYIRLFHAPSDDPAGFLTLAIVATFAFLVMATAAAMFEGIVQTALNHHH